MDEHCLMISIGSQTVKDSQEVVHNLDQQHEGQDKPSPDSMRSLIAQDGSSL